MNPDMLPTSEWEPTTPGMTYNFKGDRVIFNHKVPHKLPDSELLQLAQLNVHPPENLLSEIARRGLNNRFRALWRAGEEGNGQ